MNRIVVIIALFAISSNYVSSYRILCPYPTNSRSHLILADALFRGLAAKGHELTVISPYPPDRPIPNYRHITVGLVTNQEELYKKVVKKPGEMKLSLNLLPLLKDVTIDESRNMLQNPEVQQIMSDESFDLVIMEYIGELHIGLAAHFNCPVILFTPIQPNYRVLELLGNPVALSYVPNILYRLADLNRFQDRVYNSLFYVAEKIIYVYFEYYFTAFHNEQFPPPKYPSYKDILNQNVAAIFVTHHFSQGNVRPLLPAVIEVSGIQMTETAAPLPDALQSWMDQSTNGVVYFSLGTNWNVSSLSTDMLASIMNVFGSMKQNVLFKTDVTTIPGVPDNVRLEKWVSQIDVLQHKNIQLFITHGGFGSFSEAKFYGVPVLVIPMFGDQTMHADLVVAEGWGVKLLYADLTEERLLSSLNELLDNPKYLNRVKYESMLFRDRPITPLQTGIFWVEYIIRHRGAVHMRSNARLLNWFQLHSLDVIGFLSMVLIVWAWVSYRMLKWLVKKVFGAKITKLKRN